jgi:LmbE family N-acetylglucosaminyl deacetylase
MTEVEREVLRTGPTGEPRVLCVVAHPDDEFAFSVACYRIAHELGGSVDLAVITGGESGFRYAGLAERLYGVPLTDRASALANLPGVRRRELAAAGRILGFRCLYFLRQRDGGRVADARAVLEPGPDAWDAAFVRAALGRLLETAGHGFVLVHLPVPETHGHHQAAAILALEVAGALPASRRPVVLGALPSAEATPLEPPARLAGLPLTQLRRGAGPWRVDRAQRVRGIDALTYRVVANWAIAEHKSQGTYQALMGRLECENFFLFEASPPDASERAAALFDLLR